MGVTVIRYIECTLEVLKELVKELYFFKKKKKTPCLCLFYQPLGYHRPPAASCTAHFPSLTTGLPLHSTGPYCIPRAPPLHSVGPPLRCALLIFLRYPGLPLHRALLHFPSIRVPFTYKALGTHSGHRKCELNEHRRGGAGVMAQSGSSYHTSGLCL